MPMRRGKCVNFGLCNRADSREVIQVPDGGETVCSECQKALQMEKSGADSRPGLKSVSPRLVAASVGVLCVGGFAWYHFSGPSSWSQSQSQFEPVPPAGSHWFRMHGSSTIGLKLGPRLAEAFLRDKGAFAVRTSVVKGAENQFSVEGTLPGESSPRSIDIQAPGSGKGFEHLANSLCDIVMSSRDIKPDELAQFRNLGIGDLSQRANDRVLGLSGIAVIVGNDVNLESVDLDQLARIFAGRINEWRDIPGAGSGQIQVGARDDSSGTWEVFRDLVLKPRGMDLEKGAERFDDNPKLANWVSATRSAIGFVDMAYAKGVKVLLVAHPGPGMHPLMPNRLTILHEEYPLRRRLHLYLPDTAPAVAKEFAAFALSDKGQSIVDEEGFVSERAIPDRNNFRSEPVPSDHAGRRASVHVVFPVR